MDWKEYEKLLLQQLVESKYNLEHAEKEYKQAKSRYEMLQHQHESFKLALSELLGGE